jgi:beta-phosphoglucomutase-like phosphatase (HAD superfamily)
MIKAIIFDFDGLLIDSEPIWFKSRKALLNDFNMDWSVNDQKHTLGVSTKDWVRYMSNKLGEKLPPNKILDEVISRMKKMYENGEVMSKLGADQALKYCKDNYFILGLASGSHKELLFSGLNSKNWKDYFDEILSSDDLKNGKPAPDIYIEILRRLRVKPEESIILEDSRDGIKAGKAAGANVIAVPSTEVQMPEEVLKSANRIISSLIDLPQTIKSIEDEMREQKK